MQSRRRRLASAVATVLATLGLCASFSVSSVSAQAWLEDRERREGAGIRLGDLELHPGLGAELGYDSNVFHSDDNAQGSALVRVTPHLYLSTLGPQRRGEGERRGEPPMLAFRAGLQASLYHYFATKAQTNVGADADLRLTIAPERPFSLTIYETFGRNVRPFTESGARDDNYARIHNQVGAQADFCTRGRILTGRVGYDFGLDFFEGDSFRFANNFTHHVFTGASWKFFPSTALLYDFDLNVTDYTDDAASPGQPLLVGSRRIRTRAGLNGAFTTTFSALAMLGYASGFYDAGEEYESVVGQAELRFQVSPSSRLSFGYERDFRSSYIGNFVRFDRGYANLQLMFARRFLLGLEGGVGLYSFGATLAEDGSALGAGGTTDRSDIRAEGRLFGEYRIQDWLALNGTIEYTGDFTDFEYLRVLGTETVIDPAGYSKFEVWGGVRAFF